jgi:hypothetical protein
MHFQLKTVIIVAQLCIAQLVIAAAMKSPSRFLSVRCRPAPPSSPMVVTAVHTADQRSCAFTQSSRHARIVEFSSDCSSTAAALGASIPGSIYPAACLNFKLWAPSQLAH